MNNGIKCQSILALMDKLALILVVLEVINYVLVAFNRCMMGAEWVETNRVTKRVMALSN